MVLGIIPAGGKAERFGGCYKEMLPRGKDQLLLNRTVTALNFGGADRILVISSKEKIGLHANLLGAGFDYQIKRDTLWQSIMGSFPYKADWNLFAMPDTYYPQDIFDKSDMHKTDFNLGCFTTSRPARFGVIEDGQIIDKQHLPTGNYQAWGVLCWSKLVVDYWLNNLDKIKTYTDAFNLAMKHFGFTTCKLDYYFDMASWDDYKYFVQGEL